MNYNLKKITALIIFAYLICLNKAYAAEFSVGIFPPENRIVANTNAQVKFPLSLQNYNSNNEIYLDFQIRPFVPSNRFDGQAQVVPNTTALSPDYENILNKIKILDSDNEINNITLSPLQRKNLTVSIDIPKDQPTGDYYFSIIAKSKPNSLDQANLSSIVAGVGSNILLTVGMPEKPTGVIQDFSAPLFLLKGPVPISLLVENIGKNSFSPTGNIVLKNMYGQLVGALNLVPVTVLSHSSRFIPNVSSGSVNQISWQETTIAGFYQAKLSLALSPQGPLFERTIYFIAAPLKTIFFISIVFVFIALLIMRIISKINEGSRME